MVPAGSSPIVKNDPRNYGKLIVDKVVSNEFLFWDGTNPVLGAVDKAQHIEYFEDFIMCGFVPDDELASESNPSSGMFSEVADSAQYLVSLATVGEAAVITASDNAHGGWLTLTTVDTQNHPINVQQNGTPWYLSVGKKLWFDASVLIGDIDAEKWFIGLSIPSTDILASGVGTVDDIIGFCGLATSAIQFISNKDGTDSIDATAGTVADGTIATASTKKKRLSFYWDGVDTVNYYIDGVLAGSMNTTDDDINTDEGMAISFVCDNTEAGTAEGIFIDYIHVVCER